MHNTHTTAETLQTAPIDLFTFSVGILPLLAMIVYLGFRIMSSRFDRKGENGRKDPETIALEEVHRQRNKDIERRLTLLSVRNGGTGYRRSVRRRPQ